MRFKKLDLNLLVALDHMLELRSVTGAADRMFMSQSAMSNALTRLRTYFGDPLLVQVGRRMELTPRAESLRPMIRDILVRMEAAIDTRPEFLPEESDRTFNLLLSDYSLRVLMPEVFKRVGRENAKVRFNLRAQEEAPYTQIARGEVDLLIAPEPYTSKDHPSALLYEDRYMVAVCRHGRYGEGPIDREAFETAGHVTMVPPQQARTADGELLAEAGLSRRIEVTTFSFTSLPRLVAGTDRMATVHGRLAKLMADQEDIVFHPMPVETRALRQMMQWHVLRDEDPGLRWLRGIMASTAASLGPIHAVDASD
ncbi:LysR family transcriptional regulator [Maritimibacter sp. UBA3975]|mgnify:CR=1 FL=1|uniref:LysR family transcriptional regulator n=1 Tax=Maritimibacter sp. UBA3975 TaxID=1946833 RepID=UPI000C0B577B|nr:LysR family transcriptional regulator [Maritimibacter sp. UBA3975]MAM59889.1 nodulation protein NfeD [Maritimibacter sp.]|tara:strand:- start:1810 stop:2742 length:933 start_codon:yes stop_codon:yes gene_type:complete